MSKNLETLEQELTDAVKLTTALFFSGSIAYTTQTQITEDIAKVFGLEHRDVQVMCDNMYERWEQEGIA